MILLQCELNSEKERNLELVFCVYAFLSYKGWHLYLKALLDKFFKTIFFALENNCIFIE